MARAQGWSSAVALIMGVALVPAAAHSRSLGIEGGLEYLVVDKRIPAATSQQFGHVSPICANSRRHAVGGGIDTFGQVEDTFLVQSSPGGSGNAWSSRAWHENEPRRKQLGYVVCGRRKPTIETSGGAVLAPGGQNMAIETCPSGRHMVGGGALMTVIAAPDLGDVYVNSSLPTDGPDSNSKPDDRWLAWAQNNAAVNHFLHTSVICSASGKRPRVEEKTTGAVAAGSQASPAVGCGGDVVMSGGAFITGSSAESHLTNSYPIDRGDRGKTPDDAWKVDVSIDAGAPKLVTVYAVCKR